MTQTAQHVKPSKAPAEKCARCGRKLTRPGTVIPAFGVVGPECEQHVAGRLLHLQRAGLHALALTGEMRLPALRNIDGTYTLPEAVTTIAALADRAGRIHLVTRLDPANKEWVITMNAADLKAFVNRAEGVQA